jgi:hypothetical protein
VPITDKDALAAGGAALLPDFVPYLIMVIGLIGIGLGAFKTFRPLFENWRGLFPSNEHDQDLRVMEEALSGIYRGRNSDDYQSFRSYFSNDHRADEAEAFEADDDDAFAGTGDYEENPSPASLASRYGARTVAFRDAETEGTPRVVQVAAPLPAAHVAAAAPEAADEEEDHLGDILTDAPLMAAADPEDEDVLGDLRSLFEEEQETHAVPEAIRNVVPSVTIEALVAEAHEVWKLVGAPDEATA